LDRQNGFKTDAIITSSLIKSAVYGKWREAMPKGDSKIWAPLQDVLVNEPDSFVIEQIQFDWLLDLMREFEFSPRLAAWSELFISYLEGIKYEAAKPKLVREEA
jgi:hypothetical protein